MDANFHKYFLFIRVNSWLNSTIAVFLRFSVVYIDRNFCQVKTTPYEVFYETNHFHKN